MFDGFTQGEYDVPLENGVRNGKGTQKLSKNGEEYTLECTWENGKKNGEGILLDSNTVIAMRLNFKDDLIEGEGTLFDNGQVTFKGHWKNGERCGPCVEYVGGKVVFSGNYEHDKRNGYGILYDADQQPVFEGVWVDGAQGSVSIEEDDRGDRILVEKDANGHTLYVGGFKEGTVIRDGQGVVFDESGNPLKICVFKDGVEDRLVKEFVGKTIRIYDANGKKIYEGDYKSGSHRGHLSHTYVPHGQGKQFENGIMVYMGSFVDGHRQGEGNSYYPSHTLQYKGGWMDDKANGNGQFYSEDGTLVAEGEFVDNVYTDEERRVYVDTGRIDPIRSGGCGCFGKNRRAGTKQLSSLADSADGESTIVEVRTAKELRSLSDTTRSMQLSGLTDETGIDLSRFQRLRSLVIAAGALNTVKQVAICELRMLRSVEIQGGACCSPEVIADIAKKEFVVEGAQRSLEISSCEKLEEITIGIGACCDFARLTLMELPQLHELAIGECSDDASSRSDCFYWCKSVKFQGRNDEIDERQIWMLSRLLLLVMVVSIKSRVCILRVVVGGLCYIDLPQLKTLEFGFSACAGLQDIFETGSNLLELRGRRGKSIESQLYPCWRR